MEMADVRSNDHNNITIIVHSPNIMCEEQTHTHTHTQRERERERERQRQRQTDRER